MQIESPFGKINLHFHRNDYCTLIVQSMTPIIINGVEILFTKDFTIIDGQWEMVDVALDRKPFRNGWIRLRRIDGGTTSSSAHTKFVNWIESFFLPDLNRGTYAIDQRAAEREYYFLEIAKWSGEITRAKETIDKAQQMIASLSATVATIPV